MNNTLAIYKDFEGLQRAAMALKASGYFQDVKTEAQAIVKVMAGAELGLPPFASMSGIHIINGKPTLGSNIIATLVKNDPRYDYRVKKADDTACVLEWYENGERVGESSFTIQEAQAITTKENDKVIKLSEKATWRFYRSDMLFARSISRGSRRFAPGIFGGSPVYTPDEMGVDTDEEGYIEAKVIEVVQDQLDEPTAIEEFAEEVGAVIELKAMSLESAKAVKSSDGSLYGDATDEELAGKMIGIGKALKKELDPEHKDELLFKRDAILTIQASRKEA